MKMPSIRKLLLKTDYNRRLSMDQYQINFAEIDLSSSSTDRPAQIDGDRSLPSAHVSQRNRSMEKR